MDILPGKTYAIGLALAGWVLAGAALAQTADPLDRYNVVWLSPSNGDKDSMPIGNGDVGLNLWVEEDGDLLFFISKTDSWSENARLLKLGRVRVTLSPNPFAKGLSFDQTLKLRQGEITLTAAAADSQTRLRVWVDANNPVIHVEAAADKPFDVQVAFETWRETGYFVEAFGSSDLFSSMPRDKRHPTVVFPDVIVPGETDRVVWYHHNITSGWPATMKLQGMESLISDMTDPLLHRTFGGAVQGDGFTAVNDRTLKSTESRRSHAASIVVLTQHPSTVAKWQKELDATIARTQAIDIESARAAHQKWWNDYWNRSWIRVNNTEDGWTASKGYTLQRYMLACGGRGAQPIKFNGSIFTTPHRGGYPDRLRGDISGRPNGDPDWRQWGPGYWWQNQRLIYWSPIASGDFDQMKVFFKMYVDALPFATASTKIYFNHDGAHFGEGIYFWGNYNNNHYGWNRQGLPDWKQNSGYIVLLYQGGLELLAIMLDYYSYTDDDDFLNDSLIPMADGVITFYDQHYQRDQNDKLYFHPSQALETWWDCVNPMPEVAGLKFTLQKLLALPESAATNKQRSQWRRVLKELPPLPTRQIEGQTALAAADAFADKHNIENPELYAVFPYRLYGVGKEDLDLARYTFEKRLHREQNKGHDQDGTHAAYLGLAQTAGKMVARRFGEEYLAARFPTYWMGYDWIPDHCSGGAGMICLQAMLIQCEDDKIVLFPAWPKDWDVEFKMHAPHHTTVEGVYRNGKLESLKVAPESRAKDVVKMSPK